MVLHREHQGEHAATRAAARRQAAMRAPGVLQPAVVRGAAGLPLVVEGHRVLAAGGGQQERCHEWQRAGRRHRGDGAAAAAFCGGRWALRWV
jgi:hypothetical protein